MTAGETPGRWDGRLQRLWRLGGQSPDSQSVLTRPVLRLMACALPCSQESSEFPAEDQTCRVGFGEGALSQSVLFHVAPVAEASHVVACSGAMPLEEMNRW